LLDKLVKDIVTERSFFNNNRSVYFHQDEEHPLLQKPDQIYPPYGVQNVPGTTPLVGIGASLFNLPRFIPLLVERMQVATPPGT
jgi:uncharacterized protein YukJ